MSFIRGRKVKSAVEDSSGNAGLHSQHTQPGHLLKRVCMSLILPRSERNQIEAYGAEVMEVPVRVECG